MQYVHGKTYKAQHCLFRDIFDLVILFNMCTVVQQSFFTVCNGVKHLGRADYLSYLKQLGFASLFCAAYYIQLCFV